MGVKQNTFVKPKSLRIHIIHQRRYSVVWKHLGILWWTGFLYEDNILCPCLCLHIHSKSFLVVNGKWSILASFLLPGKFITSCGNGPWAFDIVWTAVGTHIIFIWFLSSGALNDAMWVFIARATLTFVFWNFSWMKTLPWFKGWNWWNRRTPGCVCVYGN